MQNASLRAAAFRGMSGTQQEVNFWKEYFEDHCLCTCSHLERCQVILAPFALISLSKAVLWQSNSWLSTAESPGPAKAEVLTLELCCMHSPAPSCSTAVKSLQLFRACESLPGHPFCSRYLKHDFHM